MLFSVTSFTRALMICHYVFNLEYAKQVKEVSLFFQEFVFDLPESPKTSKSATYLTITSDVQKFIIDDQWITSNYKTIIISYHVLQCSTLRLDDCCFDSQFPLLSKFKISNNHYLSCERALTASKKYPYYEYPSMINSLVCNHHIICMIKITDVFREP